MSRISLILGIMLVFVFSFSLKAEEDLQGKFKQAYDYTIKGEYEKAEPLYSELVAAVPNDPDLLYNAGTFELLSGNLGKAVLYLERALKINSDCEDCRLNLQRALELQKDKVIVKQTGEQDSSATLDEFMESIDVDTFAYWLIIFNLTLLVVFLLRRFASSERSRFSFTLVLALVICAEILFAGLLTLKSYNYEANEYAVILTEDLAVKKGPNENYKSDFNVHEGLKVRLGEKVEEWQQIWLDNGLNGYVKTENLEKI